MKRDEACMIIDGMIRRLLPSMDDKREALTMALNALNQMEMIYEKGVRDGKKIALNSLYGAGAKLILSKSEKREAEDDLDT